MSSLKIGGFALFLLGAMLLIPVILMGSDDSEKRALDFRLTTTGQLLYLDEPFAFGVGGSVKYYFTRRLAVDTELLFVHTSRFDDYLLVPYVVYHFNDPSSKRVSPYVFGGFGLRHEKDNAINYTSNSAYLQGGGGVRISATNRVFVCMEGRIVGFAFSVGFAP